MKSHVYSFSDVVRGLRTRSGLSVLQAEEATHYGNYQRWESGETGVGPDHLENIRAAFDVGNEMYLLLFAWLVDRFTPMPGERPYELIGGELRKHCGALPEGGDVDLAGHEIVALNSISHRDLAFLALTARYGKGHAGEDRSLVLKPRKRANVPIPLPTDASVLWSLYGDTWRDLGLFVARTFLRASLKAATPDVQRQVERQSLLYASEPEYLGRLLTDGGPPPGKPLRGFDRLARLAARRAGRVQSIGTSRLEQLRQSEEQAGGQPVTVDEVRARLKKVARDDRLWIPDAPDDGTPLPDLPVLPEPDSELDEKVQALQDELDRAARRAVREELRDAEATAAPASTFEALRALESDPSEDGDTSPLPLPNGGENVADDRRRTRKRRRAR